MNHENSPRNHRNRRQLRTRGVRLIESQRSLIIRFIELNGGSWSIGELGNALGMQKSTISARVNECLNDFGLLVVKPKRKDRLSNITIRPVGLPTKQLELIS